MELEELSISNPEFLKYFFETIPYPVIICDREGFVKWIAPSFEETTGIKNEDILNKNYDLILMEEEKEKVRETLKIVMEEKKREVIQVKVKTSEGKNIYSRVYLAPFISKGEVIGFYAIARNITKRIFVEEALEESERKYQELFENSPVGMYRTTPEGEILFANKKMVEILGFSSLEELKKLDLERNGYHPDNPREIFREVVEEKGEIKNYEAKWRKRDGSVIYIRENARAIKDPSGKVIYYEGTVEDITKEKEAEEKLRQRTKELYSIFSVIPDLFFKIDKNGVILDYIAGRKEDLYIPPSEFLGKSLKTLFPEPLNEIFLKQISSCLEKNRMEILEYELPVSGEVKFFESRIVPFEKDQVVGIVRDITSRKIWEKKLKESEARFRTIAENALVGVYIREDKFIYVNPAFCKIFGYEEKEIIGKMEPRDLTYEEDLSSIHINLEQRLKEKNPEKIEFFRGKRKDGSIVHLECYSTLIDLLDKKAVLGVVLDITEKKKAEEHQREYLNKLRGLLDGIILSISKIVEIKDPYTAGHQQRVSELAVKIGEELGLDKEKLEAIKLAAMIHDIGKIHIPAEILTKPGELSPLEREMIQNHPTFGYEILKNIEFPWPIAQIVLQHHEKMDGSGYPLHLRGDQIMLEAKIISVADVVEAMSTHRPYRAGYGLARALDEIISHCGTWYDEKIVHICLNLFKEKDFEFIQKI